MNVIGIERDNYFFTTSKDTKGKFVFIFKLAEGGHTLECAAMIPSDTCPAEQLNTIADKFFDNKETMYHEDDSIQIILERTQKRENA